MVVSHILLGYNVLHCARACLGSKALVLHREWGVGFISQHFVFNNYRKFSRLPRAPFSRILYGGSIHDRSYFFMVHRFMRVDALSLLLSLADVSAYSDVLVVDMVGGVITGAVAERLGGMINRLVFL